MESTNEKERLCKEERESEEASEEALAFQGEEKAGQILSDQITEHFSAREFRCKDGTDCPEKLMVNLRLLCMCLEVIRAEFGKPMKIISGYRTASYNKRCGGSKKSKHMEAIAADFVIDGENPTSIGMRVEELIAAGRLPSGCGLGVYQGRFTHFDVRKDRARWSG